MERAEQMAQIGMIGAKCQHLTLDQRTLDVIVLQHDVLLQALDRIVILGVAQLCQQNLLFTKKETVEGSVILSELN